MVACLEDEEGQGLAESGGAAGYEPDKGFGLGCHSEGQCAGRLRGYGVGGNVYSARRKGSGNGESEIGGGAPSW